MAGSFDLGLILSVLSFSFTAYFWVVKARKERPNLQFYQLSNYRTSLRRHPEEEGKKRFSLQQLDTGGVLIVNHSIRQNSIVLFDCFLKTSEGEIQGDWGYGGDDRPPWNVGPETSLAFSPACFFDVPADFEPEDNVEFRLEFITASGVIFAHDFSEKAPQIRIRNHGDHKALGSDGESSRGETTVASESTSKDVLPEEFAPRCEVSADSTKRPAAKQPTRRVA